MEGNLRFKIDWASLIVGSKFTVFALFYFVFEGNFPISSPQGAYIWRGDLTEGFLCYRFGGLIFGGAYTWRGLFSEFYDISNIVFFTFPYLNIELCFYFRCSMYKCFPDKRYTVQVVQCMDCMYLTGNLCNFRR